MSRLTLTIFSVALTAFSLPAFASLSHPASRWDGEFGSLSCEAYGPLSQLDAGNNARTGLLMWTRGYYAGLNAAAVQSGQPPKIIGDLENNLLPGIERYCDEHPDGMLLDPIQDYYAQAPLAGSRHGGRMQAQRPAPVERQPLNQNPRWTAVPQGITPAPDGDDDQ